MAKKTFKTGIDALLTPTTRETKPSEPESQSEKQTSVMFRMPETLKIKMEHHCTDKRIRQQEFIVAAIKEYLNQNEG